MQQNHFDRSGLRWGRIVNSNYHDCNVRRRTVSCQQTGWRFNISRTIGSVHEIRIGAWKIYFEIDFIGFGWINYYFIENKWVFFYFHFVVFREYSEFNALQIYSTHALCACLKKIDVSFCMYFSSIIHAIIYWKYTTTNWMYWNLLYFLYIVHKLERQKWHETKTLSDRWIRIAVNFTLIIFSASFFCPHHQMMWFC